jgi:hypothetical protein
MRRRSLTETNEPYESLEFEAGLRTRFNIAFSDEKNALRDVSIVGAVVANNHAIMCEDVSTVVSALETLNHARIPLHWQSRFYFYNLLPPVESDFLKRNYTPLLPADKNPLSSDVLITCGLNASLPNSWNLYERMPAYRQVGFESVDGYLYGDNDVFHDTHINRLTAVSRLQSPGMWMECAENIDAKFIFTRGGPDDEISTNTFRDGPWKTLIATEEDFSKQYGMGIGGSLGVMMKDGFGKDLTTTFNRKTKTPLMAARIYDAVRRLPAAQAATRLGRRVNRMA